MSRRLQDIRYYAFAEVPGQGSWAAADGDLFAVPQGAVQLGQRIALALGEKGVSIGHPTALYVALTKALAPHEAIVAGRETSLDWFQYVAVGMPRNFNALDSAARLEVLEERTFSAVQCLSPDSHAAVASCQAWLRRDAERMRFHRLSHETRRYRIKIEFTVPSFGQSAEAWLVIDDKVSGARGESRFVALRFFEDIFPLAARVTVKQGAVYISARTSVGARVRISMYETPIVVPLSSLFRSAGA